MADLRIGELFAGYGGLGMGVKAVLGGEVAWVSDIDKGANKVLGHRFPGAPNIGDITTVNWSQVEPVDVLTGGSPCQDLSHAGKRGGMTEGTRSNLWVAMREAVAALSPSLVVWENVRGAFTAPATSEVERDPRLLGVRRGRPALHALGRVLGDLSSLGYDAQWHGLRAADVGASHGRFRVFVVAHRTDRDADCLGWVRWDSSSTGAGARTGARARELDRARCDAVTNPDQSVSEARSRRPGTGDSRRLQLVVSGCSPWCQRNRSWVTSDGADYGPAIRRWHDLTRCTPAPTDGHKLSPRFSEWLMGLPAGWITDVPGITRNEALKLAGNGVVPQQAEAALRFLLSVGAVAA